MNSQSSPSQPTQNLYPSFQGQGHYIPPAAHGQIQAGPTQQIDTEKIANMNKLKQLDENLGDCSTNFYEIWLLIMIVFSSMGVYVSFVSLLDRSPIYSAEYSLASELSCFAFSIWSLIRNIFGIFGLTQKSLSKVNIAFWMTIGNLFLSAGTLFVMFLFIMGERRKMGERTNWINESVVNGQFVLVFGSGDLVYFILDMIGMGRLRKILIEREIVKANLDEVNDSFNKI